MLGVTKNKIHHFFWNTLVLKLQIILTIFLGYCLGGDVGAQRLHLLVLVIHSKFTVFDHQVKFLMIHFRNYVIWSYFENFLCIFDYFGDFVIGDFVVRGRCCREVVIEAIFRNGFYPFKPKIQGTIWEILRICKNFKYFGARAMIFSINVNVCEFRYSDRHRTKHNVLFL